MLILLQASPVVFILPSLIESLLTFSCFYFILLLFAIYVYMYQSVFIFRYLSLLLCLSIHVLIQFNMYGFDYFLGSPGIFEVLKAG